MERSNEFEIRMEEIYKMNIPFRIRMAWVVFFGKNLLLIAPLDPWVENLVICDEIITTMIGTTDWTLSTNEKNTILGKKDKEEIKLQWEKMDQVYHTIFKMYLGETLVACFIYDGYGGLVDCAKNIGTEDEIRFKIFYSLAGKQTLPKEKIYTKGNHPDELFLYSEERGTVIIADKKQRLRKSKQLLLIKNNNIGPYFVTLKNY
jgi:hypothetical protein